MEPDYAAYLDGVLKDDDGFQLRRLRAGMISVLRDNLSYKGELDLSDGIQRLSTGILLRETYFIKLITTQKGVES